MASITFFPLGNADSYRIDLEGGGKLLFDFGNQRNANDPKDKRIDLPAVLRKDLDAASRDDFDVVAFTHFDDDHVCGAAAFFHLEHSATYQGKGRIKIRELWVPAWAITESRNDLCDDGKILQAEARYRLKNGKGVRVFSRPQALSKWLENNGTSLAARASLITDAGTTVPGWRKEVEGVEFFVHSPFASRQNDDTFVERNSNSLVFQAVFAVGGVETRALLMADTEYECMSEMVRITQLHDREDRLEWDLVKLPHHCSYGSLGPEKGDEVTAPVKEVAWLYEKQGQISGRIISTSKPIPTNDDDVQPPHWQAANYYRGIAKKVVSGEFLVTMEYPTSASPEPLVAKIDSLGVTVVKASVPTGGGATGQPAPRAG